MPHRRVSLQFLHLSFFPCNFYIYIAQRYRSLQCHGVRLHFFERLCGKYETDDLLFLLLLIPWIANFRTDLSRNLSQAFSLCFPQENGNRKISNIKDIISLSYFRNTFSWPLLFLHALIAFTVSFVFLAFACHFVVSLRTRWKTRAINITFQCGAENIAFQESSVECCIVPPIRKISLIGSFIKYFTRFRVPFWDLILSDIVLTYKLNIHISMYPWFRKFVFVASLFSIYIDVLSLFPRGRIYPINLFDIRFILH